MGENNTSGSSSDSGAHLPPSGSPSSHHSGPPLPPGQTQYSAEYLAQLLKDKKQLAAFPKVFNHLERLVDEEISKVRVALFQFEFNKDELVLPDAQGAVQTLQEKVYVPVDEFPDYNFVGRILGPRGMTAKQLEQETGCKIMVRGRGSMRDKKKEEMNRGKPNWEHLSDALHVLVQCEDAENRAKVKLARAVDEIKKLLVPSPEGEDELKRKQLMELAIINGTYRPANQAGIKPGIQGPRLLTPMTMPSPLRSPTLGAPIILSPNRGLAAGLAPACTIASPLMTPTAGTIPTGALVPNSPTDLASTTGLFVNSLGGLDPSLAAAFNPYTALSALSTATASPFLAPQPHQDYSAAGVDAGQVACGSPPSFPPPPPHHGITFRRPPPFDAGNFRYNMSLA